MNGMQQGIMDAGREMGRLGGQVLGSGGHGLDSLEIVWLVLGSVLWAALMTTLVMGMIALVRHLKKPKGDTPPDNEALEQSTSENDAGATGESDTVGESEKSKE